MTEQERYENEINYAIKIKGMDKVEYSDILVCSNTPKILQLAGLEDNPILFSRKHLYLAIKEKNYRKHYKGLSITEHIYKIPWFLNNPVVIMNDINIKHSGDIIVVSDAYDEDKFPIVICLKSDSTQGFYKNITISNYLITILGYEHIDDLINKAMGNNAIIYYNKEEIQEIDQFTGKKVSNALSSLEPNIIIQKYSKNVK